MSNTNGENMILEQEALLQSIRGQWINIGLDTSPTDKDKAEEAVSFIYKSAGLKTPSFFMWFDNPVEAGNWIVSNRYKASLGLSSIKYTIEQTFKNTAASTINNNSWNHIWDKLSTPAIENVWKTIYNITLNDIGKSQSGYADVRQIVDMCTHLKDREYYAAKWLICCAYLEAIGINCSKLKDLSAYAKYCGWWWAFESIVVATPKPNAICLDDSGRLHAEGKPALAYQGWNVYAYHGVRLPEKYGQMHSHQWQTQWLLEENDAQVRLVLFQGIGHARLYQELQDKVVIRNEEWLLTTLGQF